MSERTIVDEVWKALGFCACGKPEKVIRKMQAALVSIQAVSTMHLSGKEWYIGGKPTPEVQALYDLRDAASGSDDGERYLMYYSLDKAGLTEHGSSVPGWPTDFGKEFLDFLEKTPEDKWFSE